MLKDPINTITQNDIEALIRMSEPESLTVEYKRELKLRSKKDKIELARDVSAMANSMGGWIIYGIEENTSGEAGQLNLLPQVDVDQVLNVLRSRTLPPLTAPLVRTRSLPIKHREPDGSERTGNVLIIRVLSDDQNLYQVDGRYYQREEHSRSPMTERQVRERYEVMFRRGEQRGLQIKKIIRNEIESLDAGLV